MSPDVMDILLCIYTTAFANSYYFYKRSMRYLQYFQQEEYESGRFINWFFSKKAWDTNTSKLLLIPVIVCFLPYPYTQTIAAVLSVIVFLYVVFTEENPLKEGKLKLRMTERAARIHNLAYLFYTLVLFGAGGLMSSHLGPGAYKTFLLTQFVFVQSVPFWFVLSNALLNPYEKAVQEGFANQARAVIKDCQPTIIGITGSYGKTSTKILMKDIIGASYPTFSTPGSVNTYMGVTRKIREEMKPSHKFAVIEMGAYYQGSITRMCSLTPPNCGLITTVGLAHLERFGSQENIYKAKSELAQAIPDDGILVVNGDNEFTRRMADEFRKKTTLIYGMDPTQGHLDVYMYDINYTEEGTNFKIKWKDHVYEGFTGLLGKPMLENTLGAFTMACAVGVPPDIALAVIRNAKAESNRLELQKTPIGGMAHTNGSQPRSGNIIRLNDAYNSNPVGFQAALEVLSAMPGGRKILVTPGMVELGEEQFQKNADAAKFAASICDLVLVVGDTNKSALQKGLTDGGMSGEKYKEFAHMKDALKYLATDYCDSGDVVLIENDLPDLYEAVVKF